MRDIGGIGKLQFLGKGEYRSSTSQVLELATSEVSKTALHDLGRRDSGCEIDLDTFAGSYTGTRPVLASMREHCAGSPKCVPSLTFHPCPPHPSHLQPYS
jgi:hypothetical protein